MHKTLRLLYSTKLRPYLIWIGATIVFFLISWAYMGSSLTHFSTVVLGTPGDHTAGIMYTTWVHPNSPIPGFSGLTNYPYGENLRLPVTLSSQVLSIGHWLLSRFSNVVGGWNLLVLIGYMSNALIMFGFMRWLTKNNWVSFFAAYAITYTPYHVFASRGQIAGLYGSIFILALWQFINMWRRPTWAKAVLLGAILGIGFYTDGYFILLGIVMLIAFWAACVSYGVLIMRQGLTKIKHQLRSLALASMTAFAFLLPLGWVNHQYAAQINSLLGSARGNIAFDAQTYSAQLYTYFKPTSLLFLGFSVIVLALVGLWFLWLEYRRASLKQRLDINSQLFVGWVAVILALVAMWVSLQPIVHIWGMTIHNPSGIIIALTSAWRVFGRLYALVAIGFVALAGLGLARLLRRYSARRFWIIGASFLFLVLELRIFSTSTPYHTFNYQDAPPVYSWLNNNSRVRGVAEYPLDEPPQGSYLGDYYTFQEISNKPLLNTFLPNSPQMPLRRSIVGINDPQTLPVLRALGIDLVNARVVDPKSRALDIRLAALNNKGLKRIFSYSQSDHPVDSFIIKPGPVANYALVIPLLQYFQISLTADGSVNYMVDDDTMLSIIKLPHAVCNSDAVTIAFNITADSERLATIVQNGTVLWSGTLNSHPQSISLKASPDFPLTIYNQRSAQLTHTTISKLQVIE